MKIEDLQNISDQLENIKNITDKENYNLSSAINKCISKITPIINKEKQRMQEDELKINSPQLAIIQCSYYDYMEGKMIKTLNEKLQNLVMNNYKIIDYGLLFKEENKNIAFYIKYTS